MSKPRARPRFAGVAAIAAASCLALTAGALRLPAGARAEPNGAYYTLAQASTGAQRYAASCSRCHGVGLQGVSAPPLIGPAFRNRWPVRTLHRFISQQMPADRRGSLSAASYSAILAFLLQRNDHPAGAVPLTPSRAAAISTKL